MDTSQNYIKMCQQAEELQRQKWINGHYIGDVFEYDGIVYVVNGYDVNEACNQFRGIFNIDALFMEKWFNEGDEITTWLPRQGELASYFDSKKSVAELIEDFYGFYKSSLELMVYSVNSIEQIWLSFYMKEVHGKKWDGVNFKWEKI